MLNRLLHEIRTLKGNSRATNVWSIADIPADEIISQEKRYTPSTGLRNGTPGPYADLKPDQYYSAFGYFLAKSLLPTDAIDALADEYRSSVKPSNWPMLRQNTNYEENKLDEYGALTNPLLNAHRFHLEKKEFSSFAEKLLLLGCHSKLHEALVSLTMLPEHRLMQSMLFEQAVTPAHQDWVYLDTLPNGHLTAAWVALEDIHEDAAKFFVVPGSQSMRHFFEESAVRDGSYLKDFGKIFDQQYKNQMYVPSMKKGDVLFWNSRLIHGSIPGKDPRRTRLSLAIHTIPVGYRYGNLYREYNYKVLGQIGRMTYA